MANLTYICLYGDYQKTLEAFTPKEVGNLVLGMLAYFNTGEVPEFDGPERYVWPMLQGQMDRDRVAYDTKCRQLRKNGAKGGRPKAETKSLLEEPEEPKTNTKNKENTNINTNTNTNINMMNKEKEREKNIAPGAGDARDESSFVPPSYEELRSYCLENGYYKIIPTSFLKHYEARGWKMGDAPMTDWRAAVRMWDSKDDCRRLMLCQED